jgi:hypothetical protein
MNQVALAEPLVAHSTSAYQYIYGMTRNAQKLSGFGHSYTRFLLEHDKSSNWICLVFRRGAASPPRLKQ